MEDYKEIIYGNRIILRKAKMDDLEDIYENVYHNVNVLKYMYLKYSDNLQQAEERLKSTILLQKYNNLFFVALKETNKVIGVAGFKKTDNEVYSEAGIAIGEKYQHQGYGKQVVKTILDYCFNQTDCKEFEYYAMVINERSNALAEHFGFIYKSTETETRKRDNQDFEINRYVLTKEQYLEYCRKHQEVVIETERLVLRKYLQDDFNDLYQILSDEENMTFYHTTYDEKMTHRWIDWSIQNYLFCGFGWWAVTLKQTGQFIGDCGITFQQIDDEVLPEIGYHLNKRYWRLGYGKEAAKAVRDWGFKNTKFDALYSYMDIENVASYATANAIGMNRIGQYENKEEKLYIYQILRSDWEKM